MNRITVETKLNSYSSVCQFLENSFEEYTLSKQIKNTYILVAEEMFAKIADFCNDNRKLDVIVSRDISRTCSVRFVFSGRPFDVFDGAASKDDYGLVMLENYRDKIKFKYSEGVNTVTILVGIEHSKATIYSAIAFILALVLTSIAQFVVPADMLASFDLKFIWPTVDIFIKSISLLAPPVLFFSIASSIATNLSTINRYPKSKRLIALYGFTSAIAVLLSILIYCIYRPFYSFGIFEEYYIGTVTYNYSKILNDFLNFIPDNLFSPFVDFNTTQIVFMSVIMGIAIESLGRYSDSLKNIVNEISSLFSKMLSIVYTVAPVAVFFCAVDIFIDSGSLETLVMLAVMWLLVAVVLCAMVGIYALMLKVNKIDVKDFTKKAMPIFKETYRIGSTSDAVPFTIKSCEKTFGISRKFLDVSIPLGCVTNLDGSCICITMLTLLIATLCGIDLGAVELVTIGITALVFSLGTPTETGCLLVSMCAIFDSLGISSEMMISVIFFEVFSINFMAVFNLVGDLVITKIIANKGTDSII